jgi:hypothetical protein
MVRFFVPGRNVVVSFRGIKPPGRKALRIRHINGIEVCKKRPRGFK